MSKKSERNQNLQAGKAEKAYKGYLPSVEGAQNPGMTAVDGEQAADEERPQLQRPEPREMGQVSGIPIREVPAEPEEPDQGH